MNTRQKHSSSLFIYAAILFWIAFQATGFGDEVARYSGDSVTTLNGDGSIILSWQDQINDNHLGRSGSPVLLESGSPTGQPVVDLSASSLDDVPGGTPLTPPLYPLSAATSMTAALVFQPDDDGTQDGGMTDFSSQTQLLNGEDAANDSDWGLGYFDGEVYFGVGDPLGELPTVTAAAGNSMAGEWWIAIATWTADQGNGLPLITVSLYDSTGVLLDSEQAEPNSLVATSGRFTSPLANTGFTIGDSRANPGNRALDGKIAESRLYDHALTDEEASALAREMALSHLVATSSVTSTADTGPGSLRQAILDSNANSADDFILFSPNMNGRTITLTSELSISDTDGRTVIQGASLDSSGNAVDLPTGITIDGDGATRLFSIEVGAEAEISNMTLQNGASSQGGAIRNSGTLNMTQVTVKESIATDGTDGASGGDGNHGGGVFNETTGILTMTLCSVTGNTAGNGGDGSVGDGGLGGNGGGIYNRTGGVVDLIKTNVSDNFAGNGGDSVSSAGGVGGLGGGIFNESGAVFSVLASTISGNEAGSGGSPDGNGGAGGGVYDDGGDLTVTNSTLAENRAGIGTDLNGNGGNGGAISSGGTALMINATVASNVTGQAASGGTTGTGGGIEVRAGTLTIENSIVANNFDATVSDDDIAGAYVAEGVNIVEVETAAPSGGGTVNAVDPEISDLDDFGGSTLTMRPGALSPAVNTGSPTGNTPLDDQRGISRPQAAVIDIGAVELGLGFYLDDPVATEDLLGIEFTISMTQTPTEDVELLVATDDDASTATVDVDYGSLAQTVLIPAGSATFPVVVPIRNDNVIENPETIVLNLISASSGAILDDSGTGTVTDNDTSGSAPNAPAGTASAPNTATETFSADVAGKYAGLITNQTTPTQIEGHSPSLTVNSNGSFSGTFVVGNETLKASGVFSSNGSFSSGLLRSGNPPANLTLQFVETTDGNAGLKLVGTISLDSSTYDVDLQQAGFSNASPTPNAGNYVFLILKGAPGAGEPQYDGFGTVSISASGTITASGRLGDGTAFSDTAKISKDGEWPLYQDLYSKNGFIGGNVTFRDEAGVSDFDGTLHWTRDGVFDIERTIIGSTYTAPPSGTRSLSQLANADFNARLTLTEAQSSGEDIVKVVTWNDSNKIKFYGPGSLSISISSSGLARGSFTESGTRTNFQGAVFPKQGLVLGTHRWTNPEGTFLIEPGTTFDRPDESNGAAAADVSDAGAPSSDPTTTNAGFDIAAVGKYSGLLMDQTDPTIQRGIVTSMQLRQDGSFTAKFLFNGESLTLKAALDINGVYTGSIARSGTTPALVNLQLVTTNSGAYKVLGDITADAITALIDLQISAFSKSNPTPLSGVYTFVTPAAAGHATTEPGGDGFATVRVSTTGVIRTLGFLGDAQRFTKTSVLSQDSEWPLFVEPYGKNQGAIAGKVTFRDVPGISDFDGVLHWTKSADALDPLYPAGFDIQQPIVGSRYERASDGRPLDKVPGGFHNAKIFFSDGALSTGDIERVITWDKSRFRYFGKERFTGRVTLKDGRFVGTYRDTENGVNITYRGVVFSKQGFASGNFKGIGETGVVVVEPR